MLRSTPHPTGPVSEKLLATFNDLGGEWQSLIEDDSRTLFALTQMEKECPIEFTEWLEARQPASQLGMFALVVKKLRDAIRPEVELETANSQAVTSNTSKVAQPLPTTSPTQNLPANDAVMQAKSATVKPQAPFVEPVTTTNRTEQPTSVKGEVQTVSIQFRLGRRLIGDVLGSHVEMPVERLEKHTVVLAGAGSGKTVLLRRLVEQAALQGVPSIVIDGANDLASLGESWPQPHVGWDTGDEARSRVLQDRSEVVIWTPGRSNGNPLAANGQCLDPAVLLGDDGSTSKTRISVVSLVGLLSLDAQREFLNRLAMSLFAWVKKNPNPSGRKLRGLFVVDEAKDFVPSRGLSACKSSLLRLTAQARKYHLGVVFATQNPREIENALIGNCSTQFYGKAGSPAAIETIREQIRIRGGDGSDVPRLGAGQFYVYNADIGLSSPAKVKVPMSLSCHRDNPLTVEEVVARAATSRNGLVRPA